MNGPAACSVQVVPLDQALDLKPRTMMHLFFLDSKTRKSADGSVATGVESSYKLLFCGEVIGFSTVLTPQSRAVILQCIDFSSYWDSAHAMAIEYGPSGNAFTNFGSLHGGSGGTFDDIVNTQLDVIMGWLKDTPKTEGLKNVTGLAGGIIRMMEAMGGVVPRHKGINDFFTVAELRCRLLNQVTAEEGDDTSRRVFEGKVFMQWLKSGLQNIGQQVTFRDMMLLLMRYIYYDFVPNPTARFTSALAGKDSKVAPKLFKVSSAPKGLQAASLLNEALLVTQNAIIKEFTDPGAVGNIAKNALERVDKAAALLGSLAKTSTEFAGNVVTINVEISKAILSLENSLTGATAIQQAAVDAIGKSISLLSGATAQVFDGGGLVRLNAQDQRLRSHIFRPDCWYVPAPVCNVIFPEQFSQVSYDRNFMNEVTRLYISSFSTMIGSDALFNSRTVAPQDVIDIKELMRKSGTTSQYRVLMDHELHTGIIPRTEWLPDTSAIGSRDPAEKENATSKKLQWSDRIGLFHFFKYRYGPRQTQVAGRFNPYVVCGFPGVIIRRPFIVKGGEQAVLKKRQEILGSAGGTSDDILAFIQTDADKLDGPTQFVGFVEGFTHNVSQEGGNTTISMSHTRAHLGTDDEFLSSFFLQKAGTVKKVVQTTLSYDQLKSKNTAESTKLLKYLADLTPQTGAPVKAPSSHKRGVETRTAKAQRASRNPIDAVRQDFAVTIHSVVDRPLFSGNEIDFFTVQQDIPAVGKVGVRVPSPNGRKSVGSEGRFKKGKIIGIEVLDGGKTIDDPKFKRVFSSVTVYEEVAIELQSKLPLEQVIRPNWFSPSFTNQNIGKKIYQPFFGCDSIVDTIPATGLQSTIVDTPVQGTSAPPDKPVEQVIKELIASEAAKNSLTIEKAVNLIGYLYGQVRQQGLDVDDFIRQFNDRPIATLTEVLGENLGFDVVASKAVPKAVDPSRPFTIGFHSTAFHPTLVSAGGLVGLVDNPSLGLNLINATGKSEPISHRFDIRKAKTEKVNAYVQAFRNGLSSPDAFRG